MTGYAVAVDGEGNPLFESRGVAFDAGRMNLLRGDWGWDGVVVTDWGVTRPQDHERPGRAWYMEGSTEGEVMAVGIEVGIDMFGGNREAAPVMEAFDILQAAYEAGEFPMSAEARFRETGRRVLTMKFQAGLYESAFLVEDESLAIVGAQDKVDLGFAAQLAASVMVRNVDGTISPSTAADWADKTVYVPHTFFRAEPNAHWDDEDFDWYTSVTQEGPSLTIEILEQYFGTVLTDTVEIDEETLEVLSLEVPDLSDVDIVLVGMHSPINGNQHSFAGYNRRTSEWYPLSNQWRPYTADSEYVRRVSISGRPLEDGSQENRSYFGATSRIRNEADIDAFDRAVAAIAATGRDIPLIVMLSAMNPVVPTEIYEASDAIVVGFGTSHQAMLHVALGIHEPTGGLPITFPASMDAIERQLEDVADTEPFIDTDGNAWGFGFGLNWSGVINR
jgi:beta-glucosidase